MSLLKCQNLDSFLPRFWSPLLKEFGPKMALQRRIASLIKHTMSAPDSLTSVGGFRECSVLGSSYKNSHVGCGQFQNLAVPKSPRSESSKSTEDFDVEKKNGKRMMYCPLVRQDITVSTWELCVRSSLIFCLRLHLYTESMHILTIIITLAAFYFVS